MPSIVIVGAQWGDEGKGKATDTLSNRVDYVVKFNGGNNAGHTVVIEGERYALHLLPSGILTPGCTPVIGNGVVVDLSVLFTEIEALNARGVDTSRLIVSADAHLIPPYNRVLDKVIERFLGSRKLGTTGRGIGPTYADKMNRVGLRVQDLFDEHILAQKVAGALEQKNHLLVKVYNRRAITVDEVVTELMSYAERLRPMVRDTSLELGRALDAGRTVLFEGGQATLLDVDHGTYPFVTSSNATAGGACTGAGVPPNRIDRVAGIAKAYVTRVGEGPFPTELNDGSGQWLRERGGEFGTTTGRPRRTG
ncbi:MAG: adenylosuccinate synthase, partial [Kineosporiaceae bacterium]